MVRRLGVRLAFLAFLLVGGAPGFLFDILGISTGSPSLVTSGEERTVVLTWYHVVNASAFAGCTRGLRESHRSPRHHAST